MDPPKRVNKHLSHSERVAIVAILTKCARHHGRFRHGEISQIASRFSTSRMTVWRLWRKAESARLIGVIKEDEFRSRKNETGRPSIYSSNLVQQAIRAVPLFHRRTQRKLASAVGISKSLIARWEKKGKIRGHKNTLKPFLSETQKVNRFLFCLSSINTNRPLEYSDMMDVVHVDEKWFYITREKQRFLLAENEPEPLRTVNHKSHIRKVMFLTAIARPRFVHQTRQWFDGKIGIWPIGNMEAMKRKSKLHNRGDLVWRNKRVNREIYRDLLENEVIPAILTKFPAFPRRKIRIQQDGAKAHIKPKDEMFHEYLEGMGLEEKIEIYTQPANSPDLNILDLGFFRAVQSANDEISSNEEELITHVTEAYNKYPIQMIKRTWLTLQTCMNAILEDFGGNNYKIPHMNKMRLERMGNLPTSIMVSTRLERLLEEHGTNENI